MTIRSALRIVGVSLFAVALTACGETRSFAPSFQRSAEGAALSPASGSVKEHVLWSFGGKTDGANPIGGVIADAAGNLYGGTIADGLFNEGTIFELVRSGNKYSETTLVQFSGPNGNSSVGSLTMDRSGTLFGNTVYGGRYGPGTAFSISTKGGIHERVIWSFGGSRSDGSLPNAGMVVDALGALYGTTQVGGRYGYGVVYRLKPAALGYVETILHAFGSGDDGRFPATSLALGTDGSIYGTTGGGGNGGCAHGCGTVFKLTPKGMNYSERALWNFHGGNDGSGPSSGITFDAEGAMYGVTNFGGGTGCADGCGTVYKLTPSSSGYTERVLWAFGKDTDGYYPLSNVTIGRHGALYGTANQGGTHYAGVFWKLVPSGTTYAESILVNFEGFTGTGGDPRGDLITDAQHRLYGTTYVGGTSEIGTVYRIAP